MMGNYPVPTSADVQSLALRLTRLENAVRELQKEIVMLQREIKLKAPWYRP